MSNWLERTGVQGQAKQHGACDGRHRFNPWCGWPFRWLPTLSVTASPWARSSARMRKESIRYRYRAGRPYSHDSPHVQYNAPARVGLPLAHRSAAQHAHTHIESMCPSEPTARETFASRAPPAVPESTRAFSFRQRVSLRSSVGHVRISAQNRATCGVLRPPNRATCGVISAGGGQSVGLFGVPPSRAKQSPARLRRRSDPEK